MTLHCALRQTDAIPARNWIARCAANGVAPSDFFAVINSLDGVADKVECPLFVVAGVLDRLCPPEEAEKLAA